MRKKQEVILLGFFLMIFLVSNVSAVESCTIRDVSISPCLAGEYAIMNLSGLTNAHGELLSESNYGYALCCNFGLGDIVCKSGTPPANKIIGLENVTNSHAEIPSSEVYDNDVCYENLACTNRVACNANELEVLSLSDVSSAHIGQAGDYTTKICCEGMCDPGEEYIGEECIAARAVYWADSDKDVITPPQIEILPGLTTVWLTLVNSRLDAGTEITFTITEVDSSPTDPLDDNIKILTATVDAIEKAEVSWTITQADLDAAIGLPLIGEETSIEDDFEFLFTASWEGGSEEGVILATTVGITTGCGYVTLCGNYENQGECELDYCGVADFSVESKDSLVTCGEITPFEDCDTWTSCGCEWDNDNNICGAKKTENMGGPSCGYPSIIGSCFYTEEVTGDTCEDDFLTYSWGKLWSWGPDNLIEPHYDPQGKEDKCLAGSKTVPCPAQVKLPFFGIPNFVIAIVLVLVIYFLREKIFPKKKTSQKRKASKKKKR